MKKRSLVDIANKYKERGNMGEAYRYYLEAALADEDGEAIYSIGEMYMEGDFVREDFDKSAHFFEVAYEKGYNLPPYLFVLIGSQYDNESDRTKLDYREAKKWYQLAADAGVDYAYACIGAMYYEGKGVKKDYRKAYELFKKAGEEEALTLYYLGLMYEEGHYVSKDREKAREYYEKIVRDLAELEAYGDFHYSLAKAKLKSM